MTVYTVFTILDRRSLEQVKLSISSLTPIGACEEIASDLGLGGGFRRLLRFSPPVSTG